jgi:hypothetical protein
MLNLKKLKQASAEEIKYDEVDSFSSKIEEFRIFSMLRDIVSLLINSDTEEINFNAIRKILIEEYGEDEEMLNELSFYLDRLLTYIKVPQSVKEDLLSEDEQLSNSELNNISELLVERLGDKDIYEFLTYALGNPDLPDFDSINLDDVEFDWTFYKDEETCKNGRKKDGSNAKSKKQVCKVGYNNGIKGFWRYPDGDFPNGNYQLKDGGKRTHTSITEFKNVRHAGESDTKRKKSNGARKKAGLNFFKGYASKSKKSSGGKKTSATDAM